MTILDTSDPTYIFGRMVFGRPPLSEEAREITPLVRLRTYGPGEAILVEGDMNELLFFLVSGSVAVFRAGETIGTITAAGTLLGEMSIITRKVCSASNFSVTAATLVVVEVRKVPTLPSAVATRIGSALNLLFSVTLAEKLNTTNEKARLFEITNRELQSAKKALEAASTDKIDELASNQRTVLQKLKSVLEDEIVPLRERLASSEDETFREVAAGVRKIHDQVEPLVRNFRAEGSLRNKRVLLVEDDIDEQINAKMSLGGTGVEFTVLAESELAKLAIQEAPFDIVCVNEKFVDIIAFTRAIHPATKFVFLTSEPLETYFRDGKVSELGNGSFRDFGHE